MAGFVDYLRMGMGWWSSIIDQAPLALALVDNGDGTGLVATVTGSAGGSTNELVYARHYDGILSAQFTVLGTRTGDGTIPGALPVGDYWLFLVSTNGSTVESTRVRGFRATNGDPDSVFFRILQSVQSRLRTLSLAGISPDDILWRKFPWNRKEDSRPGIYVTPVKETGEGGTNLTDRLGYGIQVTTVRASNNHLTNNLDVELSWRQAQRRGFDITPYAHGGAVLMSVPECYEIDFEPGPVIDYGSFVSNLDANAFVLRVKCEEPRGV